MNTADIVVLWNEGAWRCEFHAGVGGLARLVVHHGDRLVSAETAPAGPPAYLRAEVLRQRVLRGDLVAPRRDEASN